MAGVNGRGFAVFDRLAKIIPEVSGESIAAARRLLADNRDSYSEIVYQPPILDRAMRAYTDDNWNASDFDAAYAKRLPMATKAAAQAVGQLDEAETLGRHLLKCETPEADPACQVQVRYLSFARRFMKPDRVFSSLMMAYMLASQDKRYVGIEFVAQESKELSLADYRLHMQMISYLGEKYPTVRRTLHAGELALGLVPTPALREDIRDAIKIGGARRIGHGVSIAFQRDAPELLHEMARDGIAVELNQTSNLTLGYKWTSHPINLFRAAGVPIVISTDNQAMSRIDHTNEFLVAVADHGLNYVDVKRAVRNSLEYSFLRGASLWQNSGYLRMNAGCSPDKDQQNVVCSKFLAGSERATTQLKLEHDYRAFETSITRYPF